MCGNLEMRRRSRHDRPCAIVIWGGWRVWLGSIGSKVTRMYLRPNFRGRFLTYMYISLDSSATKGCPVSQSGLHPPFSSSGYLNT